MERAGVSVQKAADLVAQYEHFFVTLKERAASFSSQLATVGRSVEKDFEILRVALEQRKNVLLAEIQEELNAPKDTDMSELSDRQGKMHTLLQQLQQLAVQGSLSEGTQCYRELLAELNQAKQKLKETSDKYQLKFEGSLAPLVTKIASYGEIVSGLGGGMPQTKADYQQVFTSLAQQFEAQCQLSSRLLLNNRKEVMSSSPETGWLEYSNGRQWHRGVECGRSPDGVPDFNTIFKKMKSDFVCNSTTTATTTRPYSMWLSKSTKPSTATLRITESFNRIAGSHSSSWLQSSTAHTSSSGLSLWLHPSSISKSDGVPSVEAIASVNVSSWLSSTKQTQDVKQHGECNTNKLWLHSTTSASEPEQPVDVFNTIAGTNASSWLSPSTTNGSDDVNDKSLSSNNNVSWLHSSSTSGSEGAHPVEMFNTIACTSLSSWLSPSGSCEPSVMDTAEHSSQSSDTTGGTFDDVANSDAALWLHQTRDHDYSDWMLCNGPSQDAVQWLTPRCYSPVCSETSTLLLTPGGDTGGDMLSDVFGSTHTFTSFGSSDFEVIDDTDL